MFRSLLVVLTFCSLVGQTFAADYCFPSRKPPAGKDPSEVTQYVSFIFDDNGYSGQNETQYEYKPGVIGWAERANVGGKDQNGPTQNPLNIMEGDMGLAWAREKLAGNRQNPDGSPVTLTFNVITGLFVPTKGDSWQNRVSEYGGYYDPAQPYVPEKSGFQSIAVSWGREYKISKYTLGGEDVQKGYMNNGFEITRDAGHEIGNHTIDHMESNSPLPEQLFKEWDGGKGGGFDPGTDTLPDGTVLDERKEFGHPINAYALDNGWIMFAGKQIGQDTWEGAIEEAEMQLKKHLGLSVSGGTLHGFRAPRLEVNSNLFFALANLGYTYDCGLEEGYETHIDGSNFLWPYTMDNGSWNVWTQKEWGEDIYIDSMPTGLWQYPVNVMIVPENIRGSVWSHRKKIALAEGEAYSSQDSLDWVKEGKVTGFDFNMFILWGMSGDEVYKTLTHTLDLRMDGNRAPMQIGAHTDYFTPIYDNATLLADFNKNTYGLCLEWNDWLARKSCFESFADYAISKGAHIKSGREVIEAIKKMQEDEVFGDEHGYYNTDGKTVTWFFQKNDNLNSSAETETFADHIKGAKVTIDKANGGEYPSASYASYQSAGDFDGLDHISVRYQSTAPLMLKIIVNGDSPWEVLLNNVGPVVESGKIPLDAFNYSQYDVGNNSEINTANISGFEIQPLTVGDKVEDVEFSVWDFRLYGDGLPWTTDVAVADVKNTVFKNLTMQSISSTSLKLNIPSNGVFDIDLVSANGKVVQSVKNRKCSVGAQNIKLNNLSKGLYMIKIRNKSSQKVMKAMIM